MDYPNVLLTFEKVDPSPANERLHGFKGRLYDSLLSLPKTLHENVVNLCAVPYDLLVSQYDSTGERRS